TTLRLMLDTQNHRGPDANGICQTEQGFLGHNRLSIIDLSSESDQPFYYDSICLSFNGEIYNYLELKTELQALGYSFTTSGDTEVICAAYQEWGRDCVMKFVGMWAFALWDANLEELFCSRDRFGIKPFNYILADGDFYFASEIKTLKVIPDIELDINLDQVARGVLLGYSAYKEETYYRQISQLRGGFNLVWKEGEIHISRYWDLKKVKVPTNENEAILEFQKLFNESLRIHMRADVPVGSCLSGGLDSSAIVGHISSTNPSIDYKTFTIFYEGKGEVDERPFARLLEEKYSNIDSTYSQPTDDELDDHFMNFLDTVDVPPAGSSYYSQYFVMKMAREHGMKVLINGQGSDEYLIGYMHTYYRILADLLRRGRLLGFIRTLYFHIREHKVSFTQSLKTIGLSFILLFKNEDSFTKMELKKKFGKVEGLNFKTDLIHLEDKFKLRTDNFLYHLLMTTTLPTLLHFEDRNSMACSIESRVPFLDHRLVEFAFSLPFEWRVKNGVTKRILREALKEVLPTEIYERKDKKGFVTSGEIKWVEGPLKKYFKKMSINPYLNWRLNVFSIWKTGHK
ncbi:MAG: asparagine synthase (glutamine-hydrolyzing), partial [Bacteroidia bacterium]